MDFFRDHWWLPMLLPLISRQFNLCPLGKLFLDALNHWIVGTCGKQRHNPTVCKTYRDVKISQAWRRLLREVPEGSLGPIENEQVTKSGSWWSLASTGHRRGNGTTTTWNPPWRKPSSWTNCMALYGSTMIQTRTVILMFDIEIMHHHHHPNMWLRGLVFVLPRHP